MLEEILQDSSLGINPIKLKVLLELRNRTNRSSRCATLFPPVEIGSITLVDQIVLLSLAELIRPARIIEIGTYLGFTTALLAMNVKDAQIFTIDLPKDIKEPDWNFDERQIYHSGKDNDNFLRNKQLIEGEKYLLELSESERRRVSLIKKDSTQIDFSRIFGSAEFVFIDGGHDLDIIRKDTLHARSVVERGVIIWHDYGSNIHGDVTAFLTAERDRRIFHVLGSLCAFELVGFGG